MPEIQSRSLGNFKRPIAKVRVSPDGKHALVSMKHLYTVNYTEKRDLVVLDYIFGNRNKSAYSPDGSHIVTAVEGDEFNLILLKLNDSRTKIKSRVPIDLLGRNNITALAYSPDGNYIAAANTDNDIAIWDLQEKKEVGEVCDEHKDKVRTILFSADSKYIISVSVDKKCIIWDFNTKEKLLTFRNTDFTSFAVSPNGKALAWCGDRKSVTLLTFESIETIEKGCDMYTLNQNAYHAKCIAFSPNGKLLAWGGDKNLIYIYNVETQDLYTVIHVKNDVHSLEFTPDGKSFIIASENEIRIYYLEPIDAKYLFDTVKAKRVKPYDIISMTHKTPSLNENNKFDMVFQLDNSSITIAVEDLKKVVSNTSNIKYECKGHVPYTALQIKDGDYVDEPYLSIRTMGFVRDGLISINDVKKAISRYKTYYYPYMNGGGDDDENSNTRTKTTRKRRRCPNGSRRDNQTGKCVNKSGEIVDSLTMTKPMINTLMKSKSKSKSKTNTLKKKSREKFSPIKYKRNFKHALVFSLQETTKVVGRIVSKQVLTVGNVVSADHCQSDLNYQVYKIKELSNKHGSVKGKRTRSLTPKMGKKSPRRTRTKRDASI